jgi:hypothetical protein
MLTSLNAVIRWDVGNCDFCTKIMDLHGLGLVSAPTIFTLKHAAWPMIDPATTSRLICASAVSKHFTRVFGKSK